ncbi:hypothetical protein SISNIDRAFT_60833 [Sistotremastrum niveocremeum HHB9708]|uniref:BOD1/SHG1 domain-containing protein n=1 Tax=Sistotremastrum niveocremeum HHB9708 TaxID=1314777 RepID=A0A164VGQ5_9AGAM|nr:hypothetical protein SISNIDRAFT_60833 [Sistotremastrum niveocremeum HHB9708]
MVARKREPITRALFVPDHHNAHRKSQAVGRRVCGHLYSTLRISLTENRFKKSGEFDKLRREIFAAFQNSDALPPLLKRVDEVGREKLQDERIRYRSRDAKHAALIQEMDRFPMVERAVQDFEQLNEEQWVTELEAELLERLTANRNGVPYSSSGQSRRFFRQESPSRSISRSAS